MNNKCKKNEILKKSYITKKGIRVKATCIEDKGNKGKGKKLFELDKNGLKKYGYDDVEHMTELQRHRALGKAIRDGNPLGIFRRLIALSVLHKNTNKKISHIFKSDADWIKTRKEYINRN
jgi:hypothetical protein